MAGRFVVSAAPVLDLQRVASAARALAGEDGRVEAVVLAGDEGRSRRRRQPEQLASSLAGSPTRSSCTTARAPGYGATCGRQPFSMRSATGRWRLRRRRPGRS